MSTKTNVDSQTDTLTAEPELEEPSLYEVVMLNDDFTTMDFVIDVLLQFFYKGQQEAERLMFIIHEEGEAVCAICPYEIAETRVEQVISHARTHDFPLMCILRPH